MEPPAYQELLLNHVKTYGRLKNASPSILDAMDKRMQAAREELVRQAAEEQANPGAALARRQTAFRGRGGRN